jgi:hypothetical protein
MAKSPLNISTFNLHVGSVSFDDTAEAKEDWFRSMVEVKNPGTDAQAKP